MLLNAQNAYDNVQGTFSWALGNEQDAAASDNIAGALQESRLNIGSDLTAGTNTYATVNPGATMATYCNTSTSKPGCKATNMIEFKLKMKKGITFKMQSVTLDLVKQGTDDAGIRLKYVVDGVECDSASAIVIPKDSILRDKNGQPAPLSHSITIPDTIGGREVALRFYLDQVNSGKNIGFGNIHLNGVMNGTEEVRSFQNFTLDLRKENSIHPDSLPAGVTLMNTPSYNGGQHGYESPIFNVVVDGPVKFTIGGCQYSNTDCTIYDGQALLATLNVKAAGCDNSTGYDHFVTYVYNSETPTTLTINGAQYCPYIIAEACDLIPECFVSYYDTDGRTLLRKDTVEGNSELAYSVGADAVTVPAGSAFRGWFNATQSTAVKVPEGTAIQQDMSLYAKATPIEVVTNTAHFIYDLTKVNFYVEDHEAIDMPGGSWHDGQHGWSFGNGGKIILPVAGKALISIGNCRYSGSSVATVTNAAGVELDTFQVKAPDDADGEEHVIKYEGGADTIIITFAGTTYVHKVCVYNVVDFVEYNEETGYYMIPANDVNSFLLALTEANGVGDRKIFLPNGLYDMGETALTTISGNNISIIGESMEGTIIRNAPLVENEGIGTTATLLNTSTGLYLQDLTLQNALDYYHSGSAGRAVCLQDKGLRTICKNVRMLSYQDTYYSNRAGEYYWEDGEIHGTVDYLCGDGNVVMNRMLFVNESRSASGKSGSDVLCAPNCTATTDARPNWGYVFLDCAVRSESKDFTFARSWGGESKAAFLRTTILDGSLNASRWTAAGMNNAAYAFKEFGTMDSTGAVVCPSTHVMNFTHSSGNREYETILRADEAAQFTVANIFGSWAPDSIAAQDTVLSVSGEDGGCMKWTGNAPAYLIEVEGNLPLIVTGNDINLVHIGYPYGDYMPGKITIRAANSRGGFGPAKNVPWTAAINNVKDDSTVQKLIENGQVVILRDGVKYNTLGTVIR